MCERERDRDRFWSESDKFLKGKFRLKKWKKKWCMHFYFFNNHNLVLNSISLIFYTWGFGVVEFELLKKALEHTSPRMRVSVPSSSQKRVTPFSFLFPFLRFDFFFFSIFSHVSIGFLLWKGFVKDLFYFA